MKNNKNLWKKIGIGALILGIIGSLCLSGYDEIKLPKNNTVMPHTKNYSYTMRHITWLNMDQVETTTVEIDPYGNPHTIDGVIKRTNEKTFFDQEQAFHLIQQKVDGKNFTLKTAAWTMSAMVWTYVPNIPDPISCEFYFQDEFQGWDIDYSSWFKVNMFSGGTYELGKSYNDEMAKKRIKEWENGYDNGPNPLDVIWAILNFLTIFAE